MSTTHTDIISLWPQVKDLALDLGVPKQTAHSWKRRKSIPAKHWSRILELARKRKIYVTHADLLAGAEIKPRGAA